MRCREPKSSTLNHIEMFDIIPRLLVSAPSSSSGKVLFNKLIRCLSLSQNTKSLLTMSRSDHRNQLLTRSPQPSFRSGQRRHSFRAPGVVARPSPATQPSCYGRGLSESGQGTLLLWYRMIHASHTTVFSPNITPVIICISLDPPEVTQRMNHSR